MRKLAENFKANVKTIRKERGISQEELANRINSYQCQISCWERGKEVPLIRSVVKIATALGVSPFSLLSDGDSVQYDGAELEKNFKMNLGKLGLLKLSNAVNETTVAAWRNGSSPTLDSIEKVANTLGVNPLTLLLPPPA